MEQQTKIVGATWETYRVGENSEQGDHDPTTSTPRDNASANELAADDTLLEGEAESPSKALLRAELTRPVLDVADPKPSAAAMRSVVDFKVPTIHAGIGRSVLATSVLNRLTETASVRGGFLAATNQSLAGRSAIGLDAAAAIRRGTRPATAFTAGLSAPAISARTLGLDAPAISARVLGLNASAIGVRTIGLTAVSAGAFAKGLTARTGTAQGIGLQISTPALATNTNLLTAPALASLRAIRTEQLAATTDLARALKTPALNTAWRDNILAATTARSLVGTTSIAAAQRRTFDHILGINAATGAIVSRYAAANPDLRLAPLSRIPANGLKSVLLELPEVPTAFDLDLATGFSRNVAGLTAADLLLGRGILDSETVDDLEEQVVDPWVTDLDQDRAELYDALDRFLPGITGFLREAWDQIGREGPAAVSMSAHALVEALDRTLRHGAPEAAVLAAAERGDLVKDATYLKDGKTASTRRGRIAYILYMQQGPHSPLVHAHVTALARTTNQLFERAQGARHASNLQLKLVQAHLVSAESILRQLVVHP